MEERFPVMTITIRRALVVAATTVALFGVVRAQQPASQPPAPFKSGVDVVHVDVSVLDKERRPVRGLSTADFVVREDGKVRPVVAFSEVELPPRPGEPLATWMRDAAADVVTNQVPRDGRLVVILIDRTIRPNDMPAARRTAESAVDQMGPGDLAAVVFTTQTPPQNFTADRSILRAAINRTFAGLADDGSETERGECKCGVCTLETMTIVADSLRDVPERRKMLLFIGASVPVISTAIACGDEVRNARETLLRAAGVANLAIHSVDSNLLETLAPSAQEANPPANRSDVVLDHLKRQGNLAVYPGYTGGRAIQNTNAPQDVMPAVFAESQSYYVLGFTPASPNADGRYHGIKVEVKRRGVSVHPRQGYYAPLVETAATPAPLDAPPPSLVKALAGFWPSTGLPLSVGAAAFADPDKGDASVAVVVRAQGRVASGEHGQRGGGDPVAAEMRVNVLAGAYDRDGRSMSSHMQTLRVPRPPDAAQEFEYEALSRLRLKPGRHEVRVAVDDPSRRTSGSVYTYVEVPDFAKAAVSLSGVVLSTTGPLAGSPLTDVLPLTPTARRRFRSIDDVHAFVRVYQGGTDAPRPVRVTARILNAASGAAFEHQETVFEQPQSASRSADYRLPLPLLTLTPGPYLLMIEAARGPREIVRRDVRFEVVGPGGTTLAPTTPPPATVLSLLRASGAYLAKYERDAAAIVAEEDYMQRVPAEAASRRLRSDMLVILEKNEGWLEFRDVFEVDGRPVRDRDERLARLFIKPNPNAIAQARRIVEEGSRFNLNPREAGVHRTINQPLTALKFLRSVNQPRSDFKIERTRTSSGRTEVLVTFTETAKPRLIASPDSAAARGSFWIDSATGRITASELMMQTGATRIAIRVGFAEQRTLGLWVPVSMEETYSTRPGIEGRATYTNFRQFKVETDTIVK
jgi:VWFA-related protein